MRLVKKILSYLPSALPVGVTEFEHYANDVIELAGEFADRDSMVFALCTMIIHAKHDQASIPKNYFVRCLRKSATNQVASHFFQEIKTRQTAAIQQAEATGKLAVDGKA